MPSIRSIFTHLSALAVTVQLGSCKSIGGNAIITVVNANTGASLGCLDGSGLVQALPKAQCHHFFTKGKGDDGTSIWSAEGFPCSFALSDPTDPASQDLFECSTTLSSASLNGWSLKSNVLATDPQGRVFQKLTTGFFESGAGDSTTTPISLNWVNV